MSQKIQNKNVNTESEITQDREKSDRLDRAAHERMPDAGPESEPAPPAEAIWPAPYYGCRIRALTVDTPASEWPTSLDRRDPAQRSLIFAAGNPADVRCELGQEVRFVAHHWLIYADERLDEESGEIKTIGVLVLFDSAGKTFKTTSQYAPRRLKASLELYTADDWERGIAFVIRDRPSRMPGRHYHDIQIEAPK